MKIAHNISAMNTQRQFNITFRNRSKTIEKLSSGYQINRSADNAAGLAISEKMRRQIRGLTQASKNVQDGISFCQVADGALEEMSAMVQRMNELAVKSANGTNQEEDRGYIDEEVQQLKHELNRTAGTTSFNGNKIFRALYTPSVSGTPDDFQLFNADGSTMGGVRVGGVRYTWKELGLNSTNTYEQGGKTYFTQDITIKKDVLDSSGNKVETLELQGIKDAELSTISRVYRWRAEDDGIVINDNETEKIGWGSVMNVQAGSPMNTSRVEEGTYAFTYHGMTVEFDVPSGDTQIADVEMGIDGGDAISVAHWFTIPVGVNASKGVNIDEQTSKASSIITAENYKFVAKVGLSIVANDEGIRINSGGVTDDESKTTLIKWEDIQSTPATNKIIDWGRDTEANNDVTLASGIKYTYQNSVADKLGISFDFTLQDEVSIAEVKKGLSVEIGRVFDTDMENIKKVSLTSGGIDMQVNNAKMSFGMQNLLLGDSDSMTQGKLGNWTAKITNTINDNEDGIDIQYKYVGNGGMEAIYTGGITKTSLLAAITSSASSVTVASAVNLTNADTLMAGISDAEKTQGIRNIQPSDMSIQVEFDISNLNQRYKDAITAIEGTAADTPEKRAEILDNIYKEALTQIAGGTAAAATKTHSVTLATSKATYRGVYDEKENVNNHTRFGTQVIAAKRDLLIQAGTEPDDKITIEWQPISLSILGIGEMSVDTVSSSEYAIDLLKETQKTLSATRANFGAYQNRLEHAQKNLDNIVENTTSAESKIRDTDMAASSMRLALQNILVQTGQAMLAQANQLRENVVALLREYF